jgi:hypothetical protein
MRGKDPEGQCNALKVCLAFDGTRNKPSYVMNGVLFNNLPSALQSYLHSVADRQMFKLAQILWRMDLASGKLPADIKKLGAVSDDPLGGKLDYLVNGNTVSIACRNLGPADVPTSEQNPFPHMSMSLQINFLRARKTGIRSSDYIVAPR